MPNTSEMARIFCKDAFGDLGVKSLRPYNKIVKELLDLAVKGERNRCARIADNHAVDDGGLEGGDIYIARKIAEAIRNVR